MNLFMSANVCIINIIEKVQCVKITCLALGSSAINFNILLMSLNPLATNANLVALVLKNEIT